MSDLPEQQESQKQSFGAEVFDWIEAIVFPIIIVVLISTFVLRPAGVIGPSMEPTLTEGNRLYLTHFFYTPQKGDVIVANCTALHEAIVKRVIGLPGDKVMVDYDKSKVYVNDVELVEPYILEQEFVRREYSNVEFPVTVPEHCVFVMGDNRNNSTDSRSSLVGFINEKDIVGKVLFRVYPFNSIGLIK